MKIQEEDEEDLRQLQEAFAAGLINAFTADIDSPPTAREAALLRVVALALAELELPRIAEEAKKAAFSRFFGKGRQ